jgi:hypothetical protein
MNIQLFCSCGSIFLTNPLLSTTSMYLIYTELVFLNLYGARESMPRHQFRQPM